MTFPSSVWKKIVAMMHCCTDAFVLMSLAQTCKTLYSIISQNIQKGERDELFYYVNIVRHIAQNGKYEKIVSHHFLWEGLYMGITDNGQIGLFCTNKIDYKKCVVLKNSIQVLNGKHSFHSVVYIVDKHFCYIVVDLGKGVNILIKLAVNDKQVDINSNVFIDDNNCVDPTLLLPFSLNKVPRMKHFKRFFISCDLMNRIAIMYDEEGYDAISLNYEQRYLDGSIKTTLDFGLEDVIQNEKVNTTFDIVYSDTPLVNFITRQESYSQNASYSLHVYSPTDCFKIKSKNSHRIEHPIILMQIKKIIMFLYCRVNDKTDICVYDLSNYQFYFLKIDFDGCAHVNFLPKRDLILMYTSNQQVNLSVEKVLTMMTKLEKPHPLFVNYFELTQLQSNLFSIYNK